MAKIKVGISACLIGKKVRYDGNHRWDTYITTTMDRVFDWVPVCPEVEYGLTVPREPMRLEGNPDSPKLVTIYSRVDHTEGMREWAKKRVKELEKDDLCGFIFKSGSPSSGLKRVKVYSSSGRSVKAAAGIFARIFVDSFPFLPVEEDIGLHDPESAEDFVRRVKVYHRWKFLLAEGGELGSFHKKHSFLLLAHSPQHFRRLEEIIHKPGLTKDERLNLYFPILMEGLNVKPSRRKHGDVLLGAFRCLRDFLNQAQAEDLLLCIQGYRKRVYPLTVPLALIAHYARMFGIDELLTQVYFDVPGEGWCL